MTARSAIELDAYCWRADRLRETPAAVRSSALIGLAMADTLRWWAEARPGSPWWADLPADGWVTWVDRRHVRSPNPGYCFQRAGWQRDHGWTHRHLVRLRAEVTAR